MEAAEARRLQSVTERLGRFQLSGKKVLIPDMNRISARLLASTFRGFRIDAQVMETYKGLDLGQEYSSGKECFPCQITTGDILYSLTKERERLGDRFDPEGFVYFLPEAEGPCRFGMYNKFQRLVLDSLPEFSRVRIGSVSTEYGYCLDGVIEQEKVGDLRRAVYFSVIAADVLDRLLWRIRPYEREPGLADAFIERSMRAMEETFETHAAQKKFRKILRALTAIVEAGSKIMDPDLPLKPLVGVVGEIYLRTHVEANQDLLRMLERYGAEVVNASIGEWVNYTTYDALRKERVALRLNLRQLRFGAVKKHVRKVWSLRVELLYQRLRQRQIFRRVKPLLDLADDHDVGHLERILEEEDLFSFDVGTEACLSIAGIVEHARRGYNGVVNVYPFTCMPSTVTSAIVKPRLDELGVPYLDRPCDSSSQPGREAAIRTFMYQVHQHFERRGRAEHR